MAKVHSNEAKRTLLRLLATVEALADKNRFAREVFGEAFARTMRDLKVALGPWNSPLPSSLALQNTAKQLKAMYARSKDSVELVLLHHLAEALVFVSKAATEQEGREGLLNRHLELIQDCAPFFDPLWIGRFRTKRCEEITKLPKDKPCTGPTRPSRAIGTTKELF